MNTSKGNFTFHHYNDVEETSASFNDRKNSIVKMILVLLYRFCESQDSIVGFRLCEKLAQDGHEVLVTSTSSHKERLDEIKVAKHITEQYIGSIKVIQPESEELEEPSPEWIAKLHRTYFPQLADCKDVQTVIGTLPGTSQTALELQKKLKCRLVLLATTKMTTNQESLKTEICRVSSHADEVWSVGNDIFCHYDEIFHTHDRDRKKIKHQVILLKPKMIKEWRRGTTVKSNSLVTIWNNDHPFFFKGKEEHVKGSSKESFLIVSSALEMVNEETQGEKLKWSLHGVKGKEETFEKSLSLKSRGMVEIHTLMGTNFLKNLNLENCLAYIAPDAHDESFNYIALTAMYHGIPTLVASESPVGKFIQSLTTRVKLKPLVYLMDKNAWIKKINEDILNPDKCSRKWAIELSEHLQANGHLWKMDTSVLKKEHKNTLVKVVSSLILNPCTFRLTLLILQNNI